VNSARSCVAQTLRKRVSNNFLQHATMSTRKLHRHIGKKTREYLQGVHVMAEIICIRENWNNTALSIPIPNAGNFHTLHIIPTPEHPFGEKGKALAGAWKQLGYAKVDGMLILDGDVVIEPGDMENMLAAIHGHDKMVVTAPARIWPKSTKRKSWVWAHWSTEASQVMETKNIRWFTFNFTYLPKKVIEQALKDGLADWTFPSVDKRMSEAAVRAGVPVHVAENVSPKHLNF
jgi:hypothetical protein